MSPKLPILFLAVALAGAPLAFAEVTVKLSDVHLCCASCVKAVDKAVNPVTGATANCDRDAETVSITAADAATAQKAVDALIAAGYYGTSDNPEIKVNAPTGATSENVQSLTVSGVHLCCAKCVTAVNKALAKVPGVKSNTAEKNVASFVITGDFKPTEVFAALHEAGLTGKAR